MNAIKLAAAGMLAMAAVFGFGRFVYTPILPHMIADGLTPSAAGLVAAANYLGYLAGAVLGITGLMQHRARVWFLGSIAVSGLAMVGMAFVPIDAIATMIALRLINGAGGAIVMVAGTTLMFGRLAAFGGWYGMAPFCGVGLGIAASSAVVAVLAQAGATWEGMWRVTGIIAAVAVVAVAALIPGAPFKEFTASDESRIAWSRRLLLLTLSYGLFGIGYVITATFIVVITRETPALNPLEPYIWSIVGLAGAASIPFWSFVTRRIGDVWAYAIMMIVEGTGVALSVVSPNAVSVVLSAIFLGGTIMAITAVGLQMGRRLAGGGAQRISAIMTAAFGIGQVVGPLIGGHLRETTGSFLAPTLAAAAALAIGAMLALVP